MATVEFTQEDPIFEFVNETPVFNFIVANPLVHFHNTPGNFKFTQEDTSFHFAIEDPDPASCTPEGICDPADITVDI